MLSLNSFSTFGIILRMYLYKESSPNSSKSFCCIDKAKLSKCVFRRQALHSPNCQFQQPSPFLMQFKTNSFWSNPCTTVQANSYSCFVYSTNTSLALPKILPQNYGGCFHRLITLSIHRDTSANQCILMLTSSLFHYFQLVNPLFIGESSSCYPKGRTLPFELLNLISFLLFQLLR